MRLTLRAGGPRINPGLNGRIPPERLVTLPWTGGRQLRPDAAQAAIDMNATYRAETGRNLPITSGYRSYESQRTTCATATGACARPGTSVHGEGRALDIGADARAWVRTNGPRFGWSRTGSPDPWHFEWGA
jgi:LAS superfamily LD-carboxypeptidase LdcB